MSKTKQLTVASIMVVLIAVGAFLRVPVPVVPFTLQLLFTSLAGILLGPRLGTLSTAAYVALGLLGLPIFTAGGGLTYIFQPTFGYLLGFIVGTWLTGTIAQRRLDGGPLHFTAAVLAGLIPIYGIGVCYCYGIMHFLLHSDSSLNAILYTGLVAPLPGDLVLAVLIGILSPRLVREARRMGLLHTAKTPAVNPVKAH